MSKRYIGIDNIYIDGKIVYFRMNTVVELIYSQKGEIRMNTYTFYLKNGQSFDVVGEQMKIKTYDGTIVGYEIENIKTFFYYD